MTYGYFANGETANGEPAKGTYGEMTDSTIGESTKGTYGEFANQEIKKENLKENFKENHDRWMTKIYSVILNQANGNYCTYLSVSNLLNTFIGSYVR